MKPSCSVASRLALTGCLLLGTVPTQTLAADAKEIERDARAALNLLYAKVPKAKSLGGLAVAVLVFPKVTKAGLFVGGQYGEGALLERGKVSGYYSTAGASVGLQAGAETYGYAMFFLTKKTLAYLAESDGFEIGVGPSVVIVDEGAGKSSTTTTMKDDIYAFVFDLKGAMAALGIQGNKISRIKK
jgi:lipid-binding SYLF domain-containing protein